MWWRIVRDVGSLALAVALLVWGLPRIAGVGWAQILEPLQRLPVPALILLAGLQLCALLAFTFTITGALPGISHRRALTVNLAGSLVANTLPFGGALGIGATYAICRSWGFGRSAIGISVVLGGVFATAGKVLLPLIGLGALLLQGGAHQPGPAGRRAGRRAHPGRDPGAVHRGHGQQPRRARRRRVHPARGRGVAAVDPAARPNSAGSRASPGSRTQTQDVMRRGWLPMTLGTLGYFVIYFVLFWLCLHICGLVIGVGTMLAAFALGRLLTSVAVTPGGLGLVEAGSVALLVAMGADPAQAASGHAAVHDLHPRAGDPVRVIAWLVWLWGGPARSGGWRHG